jgi:hypothetical protein
LFSVVSRFAVSQSISLRSLGGLQLWVSFLQTRTLRADFRDQLLHQITIGFDVVTATIGFP